jgi:trehalose 6-phosphate phosphatase
MSRHHALSREGRSRLRSLPTRSILYAFDFDGTLARLSPDRSRVRMAGSIHEWLTELSRRAPCAIVSGRSLTDLRPRLNGTVPHLVGNHGIESPCTPPATLVRAEALCRGWLEVLQKKAAGLFGGRGVDVEDKRYTITCHYRGVKDPGEARAALLTLLTQLTPAPRLTFGHACINVLPPFHGGKGVAARQLMEELGLGGLFYIGDDDADEEVFALPAALAMSIRVGNVPSSRADFYVDHQDQVEEVIRFLVHRLDRTPEAEEPSPLGKAKRIG